MPPPLRIAVFGGAAGEIGGNRILLSWDDTAWLLDFGTRFGATSRYFEEFVKPRAPLGLRDYLRMGLLPPLEGLYRDDLWCHEPDLWERHRSRPDWRRVPQIRGVLLSHAHVDHNGCLGFLKPEIPVYTGLMSAMVGKCLQDPRPTGVDGEFCYLVPRCPNGEVPAAAKGVPRRQRRHLICEGGAEIERAMGELEGFWDSVPGTRSELEPARLELVDPGVRGFRFWRVDHSIPGRARSRSRPQSAGWCTAATSGVTAIRAGEPRSSPRPPPL